MSADEQGITLIELLVVVLILGVIGAFTVTALVQGYQTAATAQNRVDVLAEGHNSLANVTRELRAACPLVAVGEYRAEMLVRDRGAAGETFLFVIEQASGSDELVIERFAVDATGTATGSLGTRTVATSVTNRPGQQIFTAYNTLGVDITGTAVVGDIDEVEIDLLLQAEDEIIEVGTSVNIRNRGVALC